MATKISLTLDPDYGHMFIHRLCFARAASKCAKHFASCHGSARSDAWWLLKTVCCGQEAQKKAAAAKKRQRKQKEDEQKDSDKPKRVKVSGCQADACVCSVRL